MKFVYFIPFFRKRLPFSRLWDFVFSKKINPSCELKLLDVNRMFFDEDVMLSSQKVLRNTFNYLSSGDCILSPIKWDTDFKTGFCWKAGTYFKDYKQVDYSNNADVKVPRELSRCHFLLHLAESYRMTNEKKYYDKCFSLISDWVQSNPFMRSINWACTMDVAIRSVNWIWSLSLLGDCNKSISYSLYQHGWFIYRNLEGDIFKYNHNHYLADIVGLLHIGGCFASDRQGKIWFDFAKREFFREIRLQVLPSGMSFERTFAYSRLVLELILAGVQFLKNVGEQVPVDIDARLENMFDFFARTIMPDGTMPIVGDQDNGRCLPFGTESITDCRYLMSLGALLYNRPEWKPLGDGFNPYCAVFGGEDALSKFDSFAPSLSYAKSIYFKDSGFALMRHYQNYILINVNNHGMYSDSGFLGAHTHSDLFSFVLALNGIPVIIDPGTYCYTSDFNERNRFRSTFMHNTVVIDGMNQEAFQLDKLWQMQRNAEVNDVIWKSNHCEDSLSASHTGYCRLSRPVTHKRTISYNKTIPSISILDELFGDGKHRFDIYFHLDRNVQASLETKQIHLFCEGFELVMSFSVSDITIDIVNDEVSSEYGAKVSSKTIRVSGTVSNYPYKVETLFHII